MAVFFLGLAVWLLPNVLNRSPRYGVSAVERLRATNDTRIALVALVASLAGIGTLAYTARTYALSKVGQVTDRYSKAVDQLGSTKTEVRIGGIYALERLAHDSGEDSPAVVDVLTAFVRRSSREDQPANPAGELPEDLQAALRVLARWPSERRSRQLNLASADLRGVDLHAAELSGAQLSGVRLARAQLIDADLTGAVLKGAELVDSVLSGARLERADLRGADVRGADFYDAHLVQGQLSDEQLSQVRNAEYIKWYKEVTPGRLVPAGRVT